LSHLILYLTISVTVRVLISEPAVIVVCSSAVWCFYCHWLCSTDIAVGLMFKRKQNESAYGKRVTVTERVLLVWCLKDNRMNRLTVKVWQLLREFCWFDV